MDTEIGSPRNRIYQVTDLEPETILAVAERTAAATTFEDFIYRESEVDAMWTQVDILIRHAELNESPDLERLNRLRDKMWKAHDLIAASKPAEAAAILRDLVGDL